VTAAVWGNLAGALLQMVEESDILVALTDLEGKVLVWNPALARLTGCPGCDGVGRDLADWLVDRGVSDLADVMREVGRTGLAVRRELRLPGCAGDTAAAAFDVMPVRDAGGVAEAIVAVGHDLTALRGLQSQVLHAEKLASVGQLAAGVAHEINNPLTSVQMCVEAVLRKGTMAIEGRVANLFEPNDVERLRRIQEGAERIRRFTRELVAYARPPGREVETVDLSEVVEHALSFCEPVLFAAKAQLVRDLSSDLPKTRLVRDHIMQVVTNLVSNAAQSLSDGGGQVVVRTYRASSSALGLEVSDNGEGICEEDRPRVFEPFFTTKPAGRGTGLGLSVVRDIVLAHGGRIDFAANPGGGTSFTVTLPLVSERVGSAQPQQ
jgi:PAS domain S-box-containing protein